MHLLFQTRSKAQCENKTETSLEFPKRSHGCHEPYAFQPPQTVPPRLVTVAAIAVGCWQGFRVYTKWDFCRGWVGFYENQARRFREQAKGENLSTQDVAAFLETAEQHSDYAKLHRDFTRRPWGPYPWKTEGFRKLQAKHGELAPADDKRVEGNPIDE